MARHGLVAESIRWFGGHGQHEGPWEIPLELFFERVESLAADCDRVLVLGTSFGAEAALLTGALHPDVDAVVAFAPSDVVWAGVRANGSITSHWTLAGAAVPQCRSAAVPFVPFDGGWEAESEVPAFVGLYQGVLVAGADDHV